MTFLGVNVSSHCRPPVSPMELGIVKLAFVPTTLLDTESPACESENVFHHLSNLAQIKILLEAVENKSVSFLFIHLP